MIEFERIKSSFGETGIVTLVRHENVDCANLSKEDFIKLMLEDIKKAVAEYTDICKGYNEERLKTYIEKVKSEAIEYAEKKYKRASYKEKYIQNAIKNAENCKWFLENPESIFFDFKPEKGENGISSDCILGANTDEKQLERCFDTVSKSKYFKKATGWAFKYESRDKNKVSVCSLRPYVDLLLDEDSRAEQKRDEERLAKSIEDFYKGSNYWGD